MEYPIIRAFPVVPGIKKNQKTPFLFIADRLLPIYEDSGQKKQTGKITSATGHSLEQMSLQH